MFFDRKKLNRFVTIVVFSVFITVAFAYYTANLLFGDNSLEVYTILKKQKLYLKSEIVRFQKENSRLQKEYFELKNLEPEL